MLIKKEICLPDTTVRKVVRRKTCRQRLAQTAVEEEAQIIIHCSLSVRKYSLIRVWRTTFLYDQQSSNKSQLVNAQGITIAPGEWLRVGNRSLVHFTLIFNSLPKNCHIFNLKETTTDAGRFMANNIERNEKDVYHVNLSI